MRAEDPQEVGGVGEQGEGHGLLEGLHPFAGLRQAAAERRPRDEHDVRERHAESGDGEEEQGLGGPAPRVQGVAERRPEAGRGARGRDRRGEHAGEERSGVALGAGGAGETGAHLEGAGEGHAEDDHQRGRAEDEARGLHLEAPADRLAAGLEREDDGAQREETDQHAGGVDERLADSRAAVPAGLAGEAEHLEADDGEDAGHQVQDGATDEGQQEHPGEGALRDLEAPAGEGRGEAVADDARRQHLGEDHRLGAGAEEDVEGDALATVGGQLGADDLIAPVPVGAHEDDARLGQIVAQGAVGIHPLVDLAGRAPAGGEVHIDRPTLGQRLGLGLGRPRQPRGTVRLGRRRGGRLGRRRGRLRGRLELDVDRDPAGRAGPLVLDLGDIPEGAVGQALGRVLEAEGGEGEGPRVAIGARGGGGHRHRAEGGGGRDEVARGEELDGGDHRREGAAGERLRHAQGLPVGGGTA